MILKTALHLLFALSQLSLDKSANHFFLNCKNHHNVEVDADTQHLWTVFKIWYLAELPWSTKLSQDKTLLGFGDNTRN